MTVNECCNSCQNKGSNKCHSCYGKYYDGVLQGKPTKYRKKQQTNADRIRSMSDEELAKFLTTIADGDVYSIFCNNPKRTVVCSGKCKQCIVEWLKQPADD